MRRPATAFVLLVATVLAVLFAQGPRYYPSLSTFADISKSDDAAVQQSTAQLYLRYYTPQQLTKALETAYPLARCHRQAHGLGRAIYAQTNNLSESIRQCGTGCNQGCFHGALMQMFSTQSDTLGGVIEDENSDDYIAHIETLGKRICSMPEVQDVMSSAFCAHGIGHVFTYTSNYSIDKALPQCDVFNPSARLSCYFGAFMEYTSGPAADELAKQPGSYCLQYGVAKFECFRYMAKLWIQAQHGDALAAAHACDGLADDLDLRKCMIGIAFEHSTLGDFAAPDIDEFCGIFTGSRHQACLEGEIESIVANDGSPSGYASCAVLPQKYQAYCDKLLDDQRSIKA